ncbi:hypothetical protein MKX70_01275 [Paenibacillus sp. FSL R7-0312]|uniref:hypothetical protein n=1 Tax=Paenibacillus sp. FSL R7-0312 TaxID=2921682 RepID=UPI0030FB9EDF
MLRERRLGRGLTGVAACGSWGLAVLSGTAGIDGSCGLRELGLSGTWRGMGGRRDWRELADLAGLTKALPLLD